jgi:hypothetical protein
MQQDKAIMAALSNAHTPDRSTPELRANGNVSAARAIRSSF